MKKTLFALAVVGLIVPNALGTAFVLHNGANAGLFAAELFGNDAGRIAMGDLILSSLAFWGWLFSRAERGRVRYPWLFVLLNVGVGLCCALPLYLALRATPEPSNR
jgi:hypothetical protein